MKIGDREFLLTPVAGGTACPPAVVLTVRQWGLALATETITPTQARELAQLLQHAADAAEGKRA
jgi:hypothetical protein